MSEECFDLSDLSDGSGDTDIEVTGLTNKTVNVGENATFMCQTNIGIVWWLLRCQHLNDRSDVISTNNTLRLINVSRDKHMLMITCVVNMSGLIKHEKSAYLFVNGKLVIIGWMDREISIEIIPMILHCIIHYTVYNNTIK